METKNYPGLSNPSSRLGILTWASEGTSTPGRYFSRKIHWPGGSSGVTIGRGYDLGQHPGSQIKSDLSMAGLSQEDVRFFLRAAGLRGEKAREFVTKYSDAAPLISAVVEERLFFDVLQPRYETDTKRIINAAAIAAGSKDDVWKSLSRPIKDLFIDLRYRGDLKPETTDALVNILLNDGPEAFLRNFEDHSFWDQLGIPKDRFQKRYEFARDVLTEIELKR